MLHYFHKRIIQIGFLIICAIVIIQYNISFNWATCISVLTFISFVFIIYSSINYEDKYYTNIRLFCTVTIYSCILVAIYWWLSLSLDGDTYIFSKIDAFIYEKGSMEIKDLSLIEGYIFLKMNYSFDDWGAFIVMSSILKIIPHKIFLNFCYVLMGGVTAVVIFRTGCRIMKRQYAYIAAAAFTMSSYSIFFYGSFLKETSFILIVVLLFNSLYKYVMNKKRSSIIYVIIYSVLICFFRPAIIIFIWVSFILYFLFKKDDSIGKYVMITITGIVTLYMLSHVENIFNRYTFNGNLGYVIDSKESTVFSRNITYILNFLAALFGPFPTLIGTDRPRSSLYGPGLLYKFLMNLPFWLAAWKIIKNKIVYLYPMFYFIIIEALSVAFVQKGFELRLTLPHIAMYFLLAFWYFSEIDSDEEEKIRKYSTPFYIITLFIICGWGILRT